MDILLWLSGKHCESVSSFGSLLEFRPDRAPEGAVMRCLDGCKAKDSCPYDAEKIYLTGKRGILQDPEGGWPISAITSDQTAEGVRTALETGPYGRCVYHCDNNVVDHQVVNMHLQGGPTISFTMSAFSSQVDRTIRVMGTRGEITGDMDCLLYTSELEDRIANLLIEEYLNPPTQILASVDESGVIVRAL